MCGFVLLVVATILVILFIIQLIRGEKYDSVVSTLTGNEYTLSELYGVGFIWEDTVPLLSYSGALGQRIKQSISYLYGNEYREYYTRVVLAKAITFAHLGCAFSFVMGSILFTDMTSLLIAIGGSVVSIIAAYKIINDPAEKVQEIADELVLEIPNMVTKLSLLFSSGMILREAWFYVAEQTNGKLGEYMKFSCELMRNGTSEIDAICNFGDCSTSKEVKKLSSMIVQGIEKGNAELGMILTQQAGELWETKRQRMLQKGEIAAAKLLVPTMMMFVGLVLVIIVATLGGSGL